MRQHDNFSPIHFYATAPYTCSYLPERTARSQVALAKVIETPGPLPETDLNTDLGAAYSALLVQHGFRRSGTFIYRPHCDDCHACVPVRLPVERFIPDRSQRRAMRCHADLVTRVRPPAYSEEHFLLYQRYLRARHPQGGMDEDSREQYQQFLLQSPVETFFVEFRSGNALRMVCVIDRLDDGFSSVYTFFDPGLPHASLGTYAVLWQIEACRQARLPRLYLGYWIGESHKMAYKARFRPIECYREGYWREIEPGEPIEPIDSSPR
ncbi:MAG: arginyltransferase [Azoarcus sp.]|jgi:arginine-tRNA-protein transferase|nr:arginyltransferase [Azoarcus sp.]